MKNSKQNFWIIHIWRLLCDTICINFCYYILYILIMKIWWTCVKCTLLSLTSTVYILKGILHYEFYWMWQVKSKLTLRERTKVLLFSLYNNIMAGKREEQNWIVR